MPLFQLSRLSLRKQCLVTFATICLCMGILCAVLYHEWGNDSLAGVFAGIDVLGLLIWRWGPENVRRGGRVLKLWGVQGVCDLVAFGIAVVMAANASDVINFFALILLGALTIFHLYVLFRSAKELLTSNRLNDVACFSFLCVQTFAIAAYLLAG